MPLLGSLSGCYAMGMLWFGLTDVNHQSWNGREPRRIRKDAFLLGRDSDLQQLASPGSACGVPHSAEDYRRHPAWWPRVNAVVEKGTTLNLVQEELHNVGYIFWKVEYAVLTSGPHTGTRVRLVGFGPKREGNVTVEPNPDLFELAPDSQPDG